MRKLDLLFVLLCVIFFFSCRTTDPFVNYCVKYDDTVEVAFFSSSRIDSVQFFLDDERICVSDSGREIGYKGYHDVFIRIFDTKYGAASNGSVVGNYCYISESCDGLSKNPENIKIMAFYPDTIILYEIGKGKLFDLEKNSIYRFYYENDTYPFEFDKIKWENYQSVRSQNGKLGGVIHNDSLMCLDFEGYAPKKNACEAFGPVDSFD